jgi:hypothetical protein
MIIHQHIPKRKKKKPNAKQRELQASWQELLKKYEVKPNTMVSKRAVSPITVPRRDSLSHIPSLDTGIGSTAKKASPVYTGDAMLGIGQLHKSNAVPIFKAQDAIDISKMRRG